MSAETVSETKVEEKESLGKCQAEIHAPRFYDSNGSVVQHLAQNKDHFTPKSIARTWGWKAGDYQSEDAQVPMHSECHELKDGSTPARIALAKQIKHSTKPVTLEDYRCFRNIFNAVDKDPLKRNGNGYHGEIIIETDLLE